VDLAPSPGGVVGHSQAIAARIASRVFFDGRWRRISPPIFARSRRRSFSRPKLRRTFIAGSEIPRKAAARAIEKPSM